MGYGGKVWSKHRNWNHHTEYVLYVMLKISFCTVPNVYHFSDFDTVGWATGKASGLQITV